MIFRKKKKQPELNEFQQSIIQEQLNKTRGFKDLQRVARAEPDDFSQEQEAMLEIMSGGSRNRIWGFRNEPVDINFALMRRQLDEDEDGVAECFGFGNKKRDRGISETGNMFGVG